MTQPRATEDRILEALAKVPIFSGLDEKARRKLARLCTMKSFTAGDVLYEEGAMGLGLFIVTSGRVEVYKGSGDDRIALESQAAGGVLGQLALLDAQPRAASAMAVEATECLLLTRDGFDTLVKRDPEIAWCLTPSLAERVRELLALAAEAKQARQAAPEKEKATGEPGAGAKSEARGETTAAKDAADDEDDEDDDDSEWSSAMFKMMRLQYGMMCGAAKGMTEMTKAMETFLDSMAEETEFKTKEDWSDFFGKIPDAMVTATRDAMDSCEKMPQEMMDAYKRYSESEES